MSQHAPYEGATPGADSNTYTLLTTVDLPGQHLQDRFDRDWRTISRYVLSLKNSAPGTLKGYGSQDGGVNWYQLMERAVPAATTRRTNDFSVRIDQHKDVKFEWVNGGSAQTTWYVAQALIPDAESNVDQGAQVSSYITSGNMSADVTGTGLHVGPRRVVLMIISWASTGTPVGTLSLEGTLDGSTWVTIPGASTEFLSQPNNNTVSNLVCLWREVHFRQVRLKYTRGSGGTANTSLTASAYTE